jgi:hypothetical protein
MPDYIAMCRDIMEKKCGTLLFPDITPYEQSGLSINHQVDLMKAKTIYENGGFWIDADMIVMKDLGIVFDLLKDYEYVGIPGFFGARKGAPILKRWIDGMDATYEKGGLTFSDLIQPLLHDPEFKEFEPLTRAMICPIYHDEFNKFFQDGMIEGDPFIVTLYNSQFPDSFKKMSKQEILNKNWVISNCFKKAL